MEQGLGSCKHCNKHRHNHQSSSAPGTAAAFTGHSSHTKKEKKHPELFPVVPALMAALEEAAGAAIKSCGTGDSSVVSMVVGWWLDLLVLKVFSSLNSVMLISWRGFKISVSSGTLCIRTKPVGETMPCRRSGKSNSDVPKSLKSFPLKQSVNIFHKIFIKWYMIFIKEHQHIFIENLEVLNTGFSRKRKAVFQSTFASFCIISLTCWVFIKL